MMEREIKFRVWDIKKKKMLYMFEVTRIILSETEWEFSEEEQNDEDIIYGSSGSSLMQFTGLLDKNGKEIYEGDVMYVAGVGNVEIIFHEGCFGYVWEGSFCAFYEDQEQDIERVIGNIYETPELLKEVDG